MDISNLPVTQLDDEAAEKISGGVTVYAAPGIKPDGNPNTPPGNSEVFVPVPIGVDTPNGKFKGFAQNPAPRGIVKNGVQYDFDPINGTFTRL